MDYKWGHRDPSIARFCFPNARMFSIIVPMTAKALPMQLCIHGHFYQPPRENPWTGRIELQDSAAPHHDWNVRIQRECYAPNGASRLLDEKGRIRVIHNNYRRISFNFGPTLLEWMERADPDGYASILEADRLSLSLIHI